MVNTNLYWIAVDTASLIADPTKGIIKQVRAQTDPFTAQGPAVAGTTVYEGPDADGYSSGPMAYDSVADAIVPRLDAVEADLGVRGVAKAQIDSECRRRILADTFEYPPASGKLFSMSEYAQINWTGLAAMIGAGAVDLSVASVTVKTKDDTDEHVFNTNAAALGACGAYLARVEFHRAALHAAKDDIDAASTKVEIDTSVSDYLGIP